MDMLNFGDEQNAGKTDILSNMNPMMEYTPTSQFLDVNADLNSFFPRTGLTPLGGPFTSDMSQYISWNNAPDMFNEQDSYFPQLPSIHETGVVESPEDVNNSPNSEASEAPTKPKRGRPRKSRAKKQLSEEQEQDKRQKFLERNRQAASKCRERRKDWISKQDEKLKGEQMKNAELRAEYEILSQEVHNLLRVIRQHTDAGCQSEHLQEFLRSESGRFLASLLDAPQSSQDHDNSAESTPMRSDVLRRNSNVSDDADSGITNMESPDKPQSETSDEGFVEGQIMVTTNSQAVPANSRMISEMDNKHQHNMLQQVESNIQLHTLHS